MKFVVTFLALTLASQASAEVSQSLDNYCRSLAKSAEVMMALHQTGKQTLSQALDEIPNGSQLPLLQMMAVAAYQAPRYRTPAAQGGAVASFNNLVYAMCLKWPG